MFSFSSLISLLISASLSPDVLQQTRFADSTYWCHS
nr:MAG TPA: hypothetical protein [Caudoviricetes sp.]